MKKYLLAALLIAPAFAFASGPDVNTVLLQLVKLYGQEVQQLESKIASLESTTCSVGSVAGPTISELEANITKWDTQIAADQDKLDKAIALAHAQKCNPASPNPSDACKETLSNENALTLQIQILKDQVNAIHITR